MQIYKMEKKTGQVSPVSNSEFYGAIEITRQVLEYHADPDIREWSDQYQKEVALFNLEAGREIDTPFFTFFLGEAARCPSYGSLSIQENIWRKGNLFRQYADNSSDETNKTLLN